MLSVWPVLMFVSVMLLADWMASMVVLYFFAKAQRLSPATTLWGVVGPAGMAGAPGVPNPDWGADGEFDASGGCALGAGFTPGRGW